MPSRICVLPRLKLHALPGGELVDNHREVQRPPIDEGWWQDLLHDARARIPTDHHIGARSPNASYRIDRQPAEISAHCPCGLKRQFQRDQLIQLGTDSNVIWLVREMMGCKGKNKVTNTCRAVVWK